MKKDVKSKEGKEKKRGTSLLPPTFYFLPSTFYFLLFTFYFLFFASANAAAQCAMCRTTAEAGGEANLAQGLSLGILVLLVPPLAIFCAIFWAAYKSQDNLQNDD